MTSRGTTLREQSEAPLSAAYLAADRIPAPRKARERILVALRERGTRNEIVAAANESIGLTVRLLRAANRRGELHGRIGSLPAALDVVDRRTAAALIEGMDTFELLTDSPPWHLLRMQLRLHAAAVRGAVDRLAQHIDLGDVDELHAAAMLHDVGKAALLMAYPERAHRIYIHASPGTDLLEQERSLLGIDHAALGASLTRRWHLPKSLSHAVGCHHDPDASGPGAIIRFADLLVHFGHGRPVDLETLVSAADAIGLPREFVGELMYETADPFRSVARRVPEPCPLSDRELAVLRLLAQGKLYKQIATELELAASTVRSHLHRTYTRLGVADRTQAVLLASELGWI